MFDIGLIINNTISNIITNLSWFILSIWAVKKIAREMPSWLRQYHDNNMKEIMLLRAVKGETWKN